MICFYFPFVRFLSVGTALGFYGCGTRLSVQLHTEGFSCQLLFQGKEEFAGNTFQAAGSSATSDLCI